MVYTKNIYPVILCGGSGTRLWPISRKSYPKQFVNLIGDQSLFQRTVKRVQADSFAQPVIVTSEAYRFIIRDQLSEINHDALIQLVEPSPKNTAPAILAAALHLANLDDEALMLVLPSDHWIEDDIQFRNIVKEASHAGLGGQLLTFGVKPTYPETGYGYLSVKSKEGAPPYALDAFIEKPEMEQAEKLVQDEKNLWNAGIFMFKVGVIIDAFKQHQPEMFDKVVKAYEFGVKDLGFLRLNDDAWAAVPSDSIDYAIMEKAPSLAVMPYFAQWSDLGSWAAFNDVQHADKQNNVIAKNAIAIDCENTMLEQDGEDIALVGIGLKDIAVVATQDAVLVTHKDHSQSVKNAVTQLSDQSRYQAEQFLKVHRPWGWYQTMALGEQYQVKEIFVNPGASLSLQSHQYRSEHWVVVRGEVTVQVGEEESVLASNESTYIPVGVKHRLTNHTSMPTMIIETQTGTYLGEDDIIRYEDVYNRVDNAKLETI